MDFTSPWCRYNLNGQSGAEKLLLDLWSSGRLPHALLITGPRGVGKATLGYRLARFLLSTDLAISDPVSSVVRNLSVTEDDPVFKLVANRTHPGLRLVEPGKIGVEGTMPSDILVDQIRELTNFFSMTRADGGWRVAIVDSADQMNLNASNAILKVLEEPPDRGLIILVAHVLGKVLPTIRSRCRKLNLSSLSRTDMLKVIGPKESNLKDNELESLLVLAEGSPGKLFDLVEKSGLRTYEQLVGWCGVLPVLPHADLHALADRLNARENQSEFKLWTDLVQLFLRRTIHFVIGKGHIKQAVAGEWALAKRISIEGKLDPWIKLWEKVNHLILKNEGLKLDRRQVMLQICAFMETTAREQLS